MVSLVKVKRVSSSERNFRGQNQNKMRQQEEEHLRRDGISLKRHKSMLVAMHKELSKCSGVLKKGLPILLD